MDIDKKIKEIEEEIKITPKNKATEKHLALLKAKLARLKELKEGKKSKGKREKIVIKKQGDATIALIGFASVGKSTLLKKLTNAEPKIAEYVYSTSLPQIGILEYNDAKIQVIDLPGIVKEKHSTEKIKEILSFARIADILLLIFDSESLEKVEKIENILHDLNFRLNKERPKIKIEKKGFGGIIINKVSTCKLPDENIKEILRELGVHNATITINEDVREEDIIDTFFKNRIYIPAIKVLNKIDLLKDEKIEEVRKKGYIPISAEKEINLEKLKEVIWEKLRLKRLYLKPKGKDVEKKPLIIKEGITLKEISKKLFGKEAKKAFLIDLEKGLRKEVSLEYNPKDKDIIEFKLS